MQSVLSVKYYDMKNNKIYLGKQWSVLNGMAYGLTQPTLLGHIHVSVDQSYRFDALDQFINQFLNLEILPSQHTNDIAHDLVSRLLTWHTKLQQQHKAPVFDRFYLQKDTSNKPNEVTYLVALPYVSAALSRGVLEWLLWLINVGFNQPKLLREGSEKHHKKTFVALHKQLDEVRQKINQYQLKGTNTFLFMQAADALSIEVNHVALKVLRFGTGQHSHLMESSFSEKTSVIGSKLVHSKSASALVLRHAGMPASVHYRIEKIEFLSDCCRKIGFPIVIKPDNLEQGKGVYAYLNTDKQALEAYKNSSKVSKNILIERHVKGDDYRLTVLNDKVIKVVKRTAGGVTGDGKQSVKQLLEQIQQTAYMQSIQRQSNKMLLELDEEALALLSDQDLHQDSIPALGEFVVLRRKNNFSTGGTVDLVPLADVHPDNLALAVRAAQTFYLDIAGVDLLSPDIGLSWLETDSIICEVNSQPQIGALTTPLIYQDILNTMMQGKKSIPLYLMIINEASEDTHKALTAQLNCQTRVTKEGIWLDNQRICNAFLNSFVAIKAAIANTQVCSAVCTMTQQDVEKWGLPVAQFNAIYFYSDEPLDAAKNHPFINKIKDHTQQFEIVSNNN